MIVIWDGTCYECGNEDFEELYRNSLGDVYYRCKSCDVTFLINSVGAYENTFWEKADWYISEEQWTDGVCLNCSSHDIRQIDTNEYRTEYYCDMCAWSFVVQKGGEG